MEPAPLHLVPVTPCIGPRQAQDNARIVCAEELEEFKLTVGANTGA